MSTEEKKFETGMHGSLLALGGELNRLIELFPKDSSTPMKIRLGLAAMQIDLSEALEKGFGHEVALPFALSETSLYRGLSGSREKFYEALSRDEKEAQVISKRMMKK